MKNLLIGLIGCIVVASRVFALEEGELAPLFKAQDQDGKNWELKEHLGDKPIVVYFYPAAMTGGCTRQACSYRDYVKEAESGFLVVGISGDRVQNLKWFQVSEKLNFPLLSDPNGSIAASFGVPVKAGEKSITRTVNGEDMELIRTTTTSRWTFIINAQGKLIYKADKVKAAEDLQNVLNFLSGQE